jgi:hypothetical protein
LLIKFIIAFLAAKAPLRARQPLKPVGLRQIKPLPWRSDVTILILIRDKDKKIAVRATAI